METNSDRVKIAGYDGFIREILAAQSDINMAILDRFNEAGLEFAFPAQTLYTKQI